MSITSTEAKTALQPQIAPGNDAEFWRLLADADRRILQAGNWSWTRAQKTIDSVDSEGLFTLPEGFESIVGARIEGRATSVVWQDFEYYSGGPGEILIDGGDGRLVDQGLIEGERYYKCTLSDPGDINVLLRYKPHDSIDEEEVDLRCPSLSAIKQMMLAIIYEEADQPEKYALYRQLALSDISDYESSFRGTANQLFKTGMTAPLPWSSRRNFP